MLCQSPDIDVSHNIALLSFQRRDEIQWFVPVTLDDLERHNSPNGRVISPNSLASGADYVKVVDDTQYFLQRKCRPKNLVLAIYHIWRYWHGIIPSESVK